MKGFLENLKDQCVLYDPHMHQHENQATMILTGVRITVWLCGDTDKPLNSLDAIFLVLLS